jgi:hypothetical protein
MVKAYVEPTKQGEAPRTFRARVYETLRRIKLAANPPRSVGIKMMYPTTDWERVWANLHATWAADSIKVNWFKVIHDILPTNERLHVIRLAGSPLCSNCGEPGSHAQDHRLWRGAENPGMDKEPHHLDIANGPGMDPQRMDHPPTIQALAAPKP